MIGQPLSSFTFHKRHIYVDQHETTCSGQFPSLLATMDDGRNDLCSSEETSSSRNSSKDEIHKPNDPWGYFASNEDDRWMGNVIETNLSQEGGEHPNHVRNVDNDGDTVTLPPPPSSTKERAEEDDLSLPALEFTLNPFVDRSSPALGVRERHFRTTLQRRAEISIRSDLEVEIVTALLRAIDEVLKQDNLDPNDRLYFSVSSDRLPNVYTGYGLRVRDWKEGNDRVDGVLGDLAKHLNSQEQFGLDDSFQLSLTQVLDAPRGSRPQYCRPGQRNQAAFRFLKRSILRINNTDNLCCARAIVTAKAYVDPHPKWESFKRGFKIQTLEAKRLHAEVDVPIGPCGYDELKQFAQAPSLFGYQLLIVDAKRQYKVSTFGPPRDKKIALYYNDGHYDVITSLPGFFGKSYVCAHCNSPYDAKGKHRCKESNTCSCCFQQNCPDFMEKGKRGEQAILECDRCLRSFFGDTCFELHKTKGHTGQLADGVHKRSICDTRQKCKQCRFTKRSPKEFYRHQCGFADCPACKNYVDIASHRCFVQKAPTMKELKERQKKLKRKRHQDDSPPSKRGVAAACQTIPGNEREDDDVEEDALPEPVHVYFDIEATQTDGRHVANLLVAELEYENADTEIFHGEKCVEEFLEWLDSLSKEGRQPLTVLAHNFKGYDSYFILQEYHRQSRKVEQLRNGGKILQLKTGSIRFIDSASFCPFALSKFPSTFGLTELKKGYFPHLFNTPDHQDYVGILPAKDYYMPDSMSVDARKDFDQWHEKQRAEKFEFNFKNELLAYCTSDVQLLKKGCETFKASFSKTAEFNPFDFITIASACNQDFRMNRMQQSTLASEPLYGWRIERNQSRVGFEWLQWCNQKLVDAVENITEKEREHHDMMRCEKPDCKHPLFTERIQHAGNKGEYKIPESSYIVDGYDPIKNTVYEFQGCFWHGCPRCFPNRMVEHPRHLGLTMQDVYHNTQRKMAFLRDVRGYNVVEKWQCDWARLKAENKAIADFCSGLKFTEPLNPREAFFGGRTNAVKLIEEADLTNGEEIRYVDVTSLYPFVNKYKPYPVGHPEFYSQVQPSSLPDYFGFVKCSIIPPRYLYHPVLPVRHGDKVLFPLCMSCAKNNLKSWHCPHNDEERELVGTWCTPEVEKAVEMGYRVRHVYEVWNFPQRSTTLFRKYIDAWLRIKQEADGWPKNIGEDEEKRRQYIQDYLNREAVQLRPEYIEKNPGLRSLAKLMLNSFWGKFGQQTNKTQVREFVDPIEFHKFLNDDKRDVRHVGVINDDLVEVFSKYTADNDPVHPHLNIFVACFTTCWARLHLYESLEKLDKQVLYFDTDSIIYKWYPGRPQIKTGCYLGEMKDELDGDVIVEFVAAGPKNYGYVTRDGKVECKVRGFSLNSEGQSQLNYEVMKRNVLDEVQWPQGDPREIQVVNSSHIHRDVSTYDIYTQPQFKRYKMVFNKRVLNPRTFESYPFGYGEWNEADEQT